MKTFITTLIFISFLIGNAQVDGVGIGTTTPKSTLDINGNLSVKVVELMGGGANAATPIDDGVYISLTPSSGSPEFILPDATTVPGRVYVLRNISDTQEAVIYTFGGDSAANSGAGVEFYAGNSRVSSESVVMMPDATGTPGSGERTKTLIFMSDGSNWTYGALGL
ncbi:hypothetical protein ESY86_02890 [Subsaximicrobium wynnwilliamsii]|uniref:Uncharacterized protein n=1 Tax=Subsaximicrobium wynnwilliamsii TaxID=291179 RepID=A0A5C6ZML9_9FLAO|nr:hypothetical protein [Subsaximicrobium wynnwilliamsii]TXD85565.1 hypothetical protein ESY87_01200 [Subsaximicrobium wynnwilliamsii]TXD90918.1 hypothetical protein ESY86_02890 [Subsaximicrobium wynnwilliamsii]TXE05425.1 hypothetical protein ESY88_01200 [Subsaximicrobium wynnwilliamsii]